MSWSNPATPERLRRKPLRLWPGIVLVALTATVRFGVPLVMQEPGPEAFIGGVLCGLLILVWWLFFSRARWMERIGAVVVIVAGLFVTRLLVHPSIAGAGMGYLLFVSAIPALGFALVLAAALTRNRSSRVRGAAIAIALLLGCGVFTLLRTGGVSSIDGSDLHWRWTPTPEERLLAQGAAKTESAPSPAPAAPVKGAALWPGFRGAQRDGIVRGTQIETNWAASPPIELWRRPVGPGWSSFAVGGDLIYTQEQLGEHEIVACYRLSNGEPVWQHKDAVRFYESNAGAGPRGTPTLSGDRVYAFGATGLLNALDARTGAVAWSRNVATERHTNVPTWGFACSPLVVDDLVIVAVPGKLAAYEAASGQPRWFGPPLGGGYSSPHFATIRGTPQILLLSGGGATGVAPASGKVLWTHAYPGDGIVQPGLTSDGEILLGSGSGLGTGAKIGVRCIAPAPGPGGWTAEERWTSNRLKPYYSDFVVHRGHAFGFDGNGLACLDLKDGERVWKGGRYGSGQLFLLADQEVLLVLSEQGDLALVAAKPDAFTEIARHPALKSKTWNHPVLAGDVLLVRNDQEMVAFRLKLKRT